MSEWRRPLKLHELLEELEHPDKIPVPPDGSQLTNYVEIIRDVHESLYDSGDEIPLSQLYPRGSTSTVEAPGYPAPKKSKIRSWTVEDIFLIFSSLNGIGLLDLCKS
nr:unnamed protein product [Callosobruchus analis]